MDHTTADNAQLFTVHEIKARSPKAVVFYLTSYKAPWYMYLWPILRLRLKGLDVIVYNFDDRIIENDDPHILVEAVKQVCDSINGYVEEYDKRNISVLGGIGNSLGSYFMYNYCYRYPLDRVVLNSVGTIEITMFDAITPHFNDIKQRYIARGYDRDMVHQLWRNNDRHEFGEKLKVKHALVTVSNNDQLVPAQTTEKTIQSILSGNFESEIIRDNRRHGWSVMYHAHNLTRIFNFFGL